MKSTRSSQRRRTPLCAVHRRAPRALALVALLGLGVSPAALRAADYNYTGGGTGTTAAPVSGNFSTGFTPAISGATTADDLVFGGAAYTTTDDLVTGPNTAGGGINGLRFNNTGIVTVARGAGDNLVTLSGVSPFINFNAGGLVTLATDTLFTTSGFIVKSTNVSAAANPIISGGLNLGGAGISTTVVLRDTGGDGAAELSLTGPITGAGTLIQQNNSGGLPAGVAPVTLGADIDYGTLLITGNNTGFTGATNINSGRLVITNGNALGSGIVTVGGSNTSASNVVSAGGTLALGNPNYTGAGIASGVITGGITVPNAINLAGAASGNYGHGLENNSGNNTLSGVVTLTGSSVIAVINNLTTLTMSNSVIETAGLGSVLTKQGNGTLIMNNASYTGGTVIQGGAVQFNGTAPASGQISVGTNAAQSAAALNIGTGTAFPTVASVLPVLNTAVSTGALNLVANSAEAVNFDTLNPSSGIVSLGSAVNTGTGVTYTGQTSGTFVNLGGGTVGGILTLPNANQVTGGSFLTIGPIGATSTVVLANSNNHNGGTAIAGGTLQIANTNVLGSGPLYFGGQNPPGGGGTLQFTPGNTQDLASNDIFAGGRTVYKLGNATIDTNGNNVTFSGAFNSNGANNAAGNLTKVGVGTLTLQGANGAADGTATGSTNIFVRQGTLAISGPAAVFATNNYSSIGQVNGDNGTLVVSGGAKVRVAGDFNVSDVNTSRGNVFVSDTANAGTSLNVSTLYVGKSGTSTGVLVQTGGTVTNNGGGDWRIGGGNVLTTDVNATGSWDVSGGTANIGPNFQVGAYGIGQLTISGTGAVTVASFPSIGRFGGTTAASGSYGVLNVFNGGTFTQSGTGNFLLVGENGTGILNVSGGGVVNAQNGAQLRIGNVAAASIGVVNLGTGGTLNARAVNTVAGATSVFNFHGGTLVAATSAAGAAPTTAFMAGLTNAYVWGEGGTINTGTSNITIAQPLLAPGTGGVQTIAVANGGTGYQGNPVIKILSSTGIGVGASAVPVLTNGVLTAITITNPGNGYTAPVVTINGGNPTTAATLGAVTVNPAASAGGALTKIGTGTLTLTGTNTYTGGTLINAGVLIAAANGTLGTGNVTIASAATLTINAGITNAIADAASLSISGAGGVFGKLNLLNVQTETVNTLSLNGVFQPPGLYGSSASAADFNNDNYFTGTGTLRVTMIPEPGTWALLGLGAVVLGAVQYRRRKAA